MDRDASVVQALEFIWLALILSLTKLRILIQTLITTIIDTVTNPCLKKREKRECTSFVEPVRFFSDISFDVYEAVCLKASYT